MRILSLRRTAFARQGTVSLEYALLAAVVTSAFLLGSTGFSGNVSAAFSQMGAATEGTSFYAKTLD
jgi:Flp pilus assembly pilin Flp